MIGKGHIRIEFERAMVMRKLLLEGNESTYLTLAQSTVSEDKDALFNAINDDLFNGKAPFGNRIELTSFKDISKQITQFISKDKKKADDLFNLKADGIGRGEIMLAYIVKNLAIGGGSQNIDLTLFSKNGGVVEQAELKEVEIDNEGWLKNWRTGVNHRGYIIQAMTDLKALYYGLLDSGLPELDPSTPKGKKIQRSVGNGELSSFKTLARDIDPVEVITPLSFNIQITPTKELNISTSAGELIGDLSKKETLDKTRNMLSQQNTVILKSIKTIEEELVAGFSSIDEKFVFIEGIKGNPKKLGRIIYMDRLPSDVAKHQIDTITQGNIKVKVKI